MAASEQADLSQFQGDPDGLGEHAFRSMDILARALHVRNAELEPALQVIVSTAVTTLKSAQHAGLITVSGGVLVPQAATGRPPELRYLSKASQDVNMKLTAVARHLVETGELGNAPHTER